MNNTFKTFVAFSLLAVSAQGKENIAKNGSAPVRAVVQRTAAVCTEPSAQVDLKINNVRARVFSAGDMWWNLVEGSGSQAEYEVPRGNGTTSMFAGSVWIGGYDGAGNLKVAGQTYRQNSVNDFFTGPIGYDSQNAMTTDLNICNYYDRIWKVSQNDVKNFIATGVATKDIREWPGNNDKVSNPKLTKLAPYEDVNGDGVYNTQDGDYPKYVLNSTYDINPDDTTRLLCNDYIFGDETLWWVFNDIGNVKTETTSLPIGLEVRAQAFAFQTDNAINDMTFYKYQIINSSSLSFDSTFFGWWSDPDLGDAADDWAGCDTVLGLGYIYNATNNDGTATGYGANPPAVGVDFFQGPIGDDGKEIKMTMFRYYVNDFSNYGNPEALDDYYQYLTGSWKNGDFMTADNQAGLSTPASGFPRTNFLFPGDPNGSGWSEASAGNPGADKRTIQAAGKFRLLPGAINYITVGVVWARKDGRNNLENVAELKKADDKAQGLFNACFKTLDGPNAPDVQITELNNKIILSLKNFNNPEVEKYAQIDPAISALNVPDPEMRKYRFQGYLIYQVKNPTISSSSIIVGDAFGTSTSNAVLLYQMDIKDTVADIYNYYQTPTGEFVSRLMVQGKNEGLKHSFEISTDAFNSNSDLINHKSYYYLVLSYAYNNFSQFDVQNPDADNAQVKPFIIGRNNVSVVSAIPHPPETELNGLVFNSEIGDGVKVTRIEGQGNAGLMLDMSNEEVDKALSGPDYVNLNPVYEFGGGPLNVTVYDPLYVAHGHFDFKLSGVSDQSTWIVKEEETNSADTSTYPIAQPNSQILETTDVTDESKVFDWGLTADINNNVVEAGISYLGNNNGFLGSSITYADSTAAWLTGVKDNNSNLLSAFNWIRQEDYFGKDTNAVYEKVIGGTWAPFKLANKDSLTYGPKYRTTLSPADEQFYKMDGPNGIFSVDVVFTSDKDKWTRCPVFEMGLNATLTEGGAYRFNLRKASSVDKNGNTGDGVVTSDPNDADYISDKGMGWFPGYAVNIETGERLNMAFSENSTLTDDNGRNMKWDPTSRTTDDNGNIVFGGMHYIYVFNARTTTGANDIPRYDMGQKFVGILNSNPSAGVKNQLYGNISWTSIPLLAEGQSLLSNEARVKIRVARKYRAFNTNLSTSTYLTFNGLDSVRKGIPYYVISGSLTAGYNALSYTAGSTFMVPNDEIIVDSTFTTATSGVVLAPTTNGAFPYYTFETDGLEPTTGDVSTAKNALSLIKVVPNPYYAYSSYDNSTNVSWAKITNLPAKCKVSIFTLNGTLVRRFSRDVSNNLIQGTKVGLSVGTEEGSGNYDTSLDWDLKNQKGIPVASGAYIIHVDAPGLGEVALKWFAVMRPISLDNY